MAEPLRYLENARRILKSAHREGNIYLDVKPVREAFGTAYLAVLEAINEKLPQEGLLKKQLPKSVDSYGDFLKKHFAVHNGKLLREFDMLYDTLHIAGYYRGLIREVTIVKDALDLAEKFVKKIR